MKFALFMEPRFITVFTIAWYISMPLATWIQSEFTHPTSLWYILILYSHLRIDLRSGLSVLDSPTNLFYIPIVSSALYMSNRSPWFYSPNNIWLLVIRFFHSAVIPSFLDRNTVITLFTNTLSPYNSNLSKIKRQDDSFIYFSLYVFKYHKGREMF